MPIGGVVISTRPGDLEAVQQELAGMAGVELYGADERGNIVAVFDTRTSADMEQLMRAVNACPLVLHAGLTYLNMEDAPMDEGAGAQPEAAGQGGAGE